MLDIDIEVAPTQTALDVVSVAEMARHIRISSTLAANAQWAGMLTDAITDSVDKLHGIGGELNRTVLPTTYRRYISRFPTNDECGKPRPILIPYPPLIQVLGITIEDGSSPDNVVDETSYIVKPGMLIPEIHPVDAWPTMTAGPRAVSILYRCGYSIFPPKLKRFVKFLGAHYIENPEASILEMNKTLIDRNVLFALDDLRAALKISNGYDDWNED